MSRLGAIAGILDKSNTSNEVWADSAYRSVETEARLKGKGYKSRIHGLSEYSRRHLGSAKREVPIADSCTAANAIPIIRRREREAFSLNVG
jgi:hypothetical protein